MNAQSDQDLNWLPAWRLQELIADRHLSPLALTKHFLARAEELDQTLRCFQELNPKAALKQATLAERSVLAGDQLEPLHGIPISIKAHIPVKGFGVYAMFGKVKPPALANGDAPIVARLRKAGAIVFGTSVMPGMGYEQLRGHNSEPTDDLSLHARNPWDLSRVPGSSSSGAASMVAAGVLPLAIGSDGGGSTRLPAAWCGAVGIHPTMGRVPSGGRGAGGWNTTLGPITRDVRDTALVMNAIAGPHGGTVLSLQDQPPNYLASIDQGAAELSLAWTDDFGFAATYAGPESQTVIDTVRGAAQQFESLGATVEPCETSWADWWPHPIPMMEPDGVSHEQYQAAEDARQEWWTKLRQAIREPGSANIGQGCDLLLSPTSQHIAFKTDRWAKAWAGDDPYPNGSFVPTWTAHTFIHNWLGWPAVSVPCGFVDGMPVGLQITGRPNSEALILRAAHAFLTAFPADTRPPVC